MQVCRATMDDLYEMQHCNLRCLPENYNLRYYYYHLLSWPQLLYVQKDYNNNTVGYVLAKVDDEDKKDEKHGHITSLSVLRTHRKLGVASRVMRLSMKDMEDEYQAGYCSLHVRKTNDAALHLYQDSLHFRAAGVEQAYYADQEDAYHMKCFFNQPNTGLYVDHEKKMVKRPAVNKDGVITHADPTESGDISKKSSKKSDQKQQDLEALIAEVEGVGKGGKSKNKSKQSGKKK